MTFKRLVAVAVVVALLIGGGLGVLMYRLGALAAAPGPRLLPTAVLLRQVQALSDLVTVKYTLEKLVVLEDPKFIGGIIPLGENRITLLAHGVVKAGVDLSQFKAGDLQVEGRRVTFRLPKAAVCDAYLVEQHTQVLDRKTGLFRVFDATLEAAARREALLQITRAARNGGIEAEAALRARKELEILFKLAGFETVEILPVLEAPAK